MSRARQDSANSPVALFPFLAVLICTMGVMIILLVVASKAAEVHQQKADSAAMSQFTQQQEQLDFEQQAEELTSEVLLNGRADVQHRLEQARLRRSHVEQELRELEQRFNELMSRAKQLQNAQHSDPATDVEIEQLQRQLADAQAELEKVRADAAAKPTSYAIVAHPSTNGTLRRPIYIECSAAGIMLQPNGIVISPEDLNAPLLPGNPLDTALLAVREYWIENQLAGDHGEPYPLLVVRPGGAQAFGLARQAMQSWNEEFGYELIEDEMVIDYGPKDEALEKVLRAAIASSKQQYAAIQNIARVNHQAQSQAGEGPTGLAPSRDGGFEFIGPEPTEKSKTGAPTQPRDGNDPTSSAMHADSGKNATNASDAERGQTAPSSSTAHGSVPSSGADSLAKVRGKGWALANQNQSATAYRRPITVYCDRDSLTIHDATNPGRRKTIHCRGDVAGIDSFVQGIWKIIDSWGIAERNGYWKPELRFVVMTGGQPLFENVRAMMEDSGFDIHEEAHR